MLDHFWVCKLGGRDVYCLVTFMLVIPGKYAVGF